METLELLKEKVDCLLKKYAEIETENKQLKETLVSKELIIGTLQQKLIDSDKNLAWKQLKDSLSKDEEKESLKQYLDTVIVEIDKVLNALNE